MSDHTPTLADVCSAIAEGRLVANSDGSTYQVNAFELRRYFDHREDLPTNTFLETLALMSMNAYEQGYQDYSCGMGR